MKNPNYGRKQRKASALKLKVEREGRSPQEQIYILDKRLGESVGAKKERSRLWAKITTTPAL